MIRVHKSRLRLQAADAALLAAARMLGRQSPRSPDPGPFTDPLETLQPQRRLPAACAAGWGCVSEATDSARTVIRMRSQELEEALQYPQSSASTDEIAILREGSPFPERHARGRLLEAQSCIHATCPHKVHKLVFATGENATEVSQSFRRTWREIRLFLCSAPLLGDHRLERSLLGLLMRPVALATR